MRPTSASPSIRIRRCRETRGMAAEASKARSPTCTCRKSRRAWPSEHGRDQPAIRQRDARVGKEAGRQRGQAASVWPITPYCSPVCTKRNQIRARCPGVCGLAPGGGDRLITLASAAFNDKVRRCARGPADGSSMAMSTLSPWTFMGSVIRRQSTTWADATANMDCRLATCAPSAEERRAIRAAGQPAPPPWPPGGPPRCGACSPKAVYTRLLAQP